MPDATLHLHPPAFPRTFEPFNCVHEPAMQICDASIRWKPNGGGHIEVPHARCLACGAPVKKTKPGNIFVDIACLLKVEGFQIGAIRARLNAMQDIYLRRAEILFGPDGWLGDESWRGLAEIIDPNLTMRVEHAGAHGDGTRFLRLGVDEEYWPDPETMAAAQLDLFGAT